MSKFDRLSSFVPENSGYLKTSEAVELGISGSCISEYVRTRGLVCVAQGLYMAQDAWNDRMKGEVANTESVMDIGETIIKRNINAFLALAE